MSSQKETTKATKNDAAIDTARLLYAVMKLSTNLMVYGNSEKVHGVAGFIPVYDTESEAKEAAENGKYQILAISA